MSTSPARTTYIWSPGSPSLKTVSPALNGMKNSEFRKRWLSCMLITLTLTMISFKSDFGGNQPTPLLGRWAGRIGIEFLRCRSNYRNLDFRCPGIHAQNARVKAITDNDTQQTCRRATYKTPSILARASPCQSGGRFLGWLELCGAMQSHSVSTRLLTRMASA